MGTAILQNLTATNELKKAVYAKKMIDTIIELSETETRKQFNDCINHLLSTQKQDGRKTQHSTETKASNFRRKKQDGRNRSSHNTLKGSDSTPPTLSLRRKKTTLPLAITETKPPVDILTFRLGSFDTEIQRLAAAALWNITKHEEIMENLDNFLSISDTMERLTPGCVCV